MAHILVGNVLIVAVVVVVVNIKRWLHQHSERQEQSAGVTLIQAKAFKRLRFLIM